LRSEAAFGALCGVSPVEASSGKIVSFRLNRGGDRNANRALYLIVLNRLSNDERTKRYVANRPNKPMKAIIRCLKRYVARELFVLIVDPPTVPDGTVLRTVRQQHGLTMTTAAKALNVAPARLSEIERQVRFDSDLATRYENWLNARTAAA
jgi:transposase